MSDVFLRFMPAAFRRRWGLDECEQRFERIVRSRSTQWQANNGPRILVQMPKDYFCLSLFSVAVAALRPSALAGLWHQSIMSMPRDEAGSAFRKPFRKLAAILDRQKWARLYRALGLDGIVDLEPGARISESNRTRALEIWKSLRTKDDVLNLSLDGIACGDLVYDTYLRYRVQPTVALEDDFLVYLIARSIDAIAASRSIFSNGRWQIFLTNYTSYIQHGIPARVALDMNVQVCSAGNLSQFFKKLSAADPLHTTAHWNYKETFLQLPDQVAAKQEALAMLESRFAGGVDRATLYMKNSAFSDSAYEVPAGIEGVMFLHDFFDSPHCHRSMLFADFLEWARFSLQLIQEHQLPIAVKPHPNQLPESHDVVRQLQTEFPRVSWLPAKLSNRILFRSGILCGVSVYGTILHELAFHGIPGLAAGDHPHTAFDIAITPRTIEDYRTKLLAFRNLKLSDNARDEVLAFYYMHNLHADEGLEIPLDDLGLRAIGPSDSTRLDAFLDRHPNFPMLSLAI
jgi:hypothetical protein